jgi:hypothetical protein
MGKRLSRADRAHSEEDAADARVEAYKWFCLAAAQGYLGAVTQMERMTLRMSLLEVTNGNKRCGNFVPTGGNEEKG